MRWKRARRLALEQSYDELRSAYLRLLAERDRLADELRAANDEADYLRQLVES